MGFAYLVFSDLGLILDCLEFILKALGTSEVLVIPISAKTLKFKAPQNNEAVQIRARVIDLKFHTK